MIDPLDERIARAIVCEYEGRPGADHEFYTDGTGPAWKEWLPEAQACRRAIEEAGKRIVDAHEPYSSWLARRIAPGPGDPT